MTNTYIANKINNEFTTIESIFKLLGDYADGREFTVHDVTKGQVLFYENGEKDCWGRLRTPMFNGGAMRRLVSRGLAEKVGEKDCLFCAGYDRKGREIYRKGKIYIYRIIKTPKDYKREMLLEILNTVANEY